MFFVIVYFGGMSVCLSVYLSPGNHGSRETSRRAHCPVRHKTSDYTDCWWTMDTDTCFLQEGLRKVNL